jgi:hypothetical protein
MDPEAKVLAADALASLPLLLPLQMLQKTPSMQSSGHVGWPS